MAQGICDIRLVGGGGYAHFSLVTQTVRVYFMCACECVCVYMCVRACVSRRHACIGVPMHVNVKGQCLMSSLLFFTLFFF